MRRLAEGMQDSNQNSSPVEGSCQGISGTGCLENDSRG